jgi:alpha-methylacyl-CoA racemase
MVTGAVTADRALSGTTVVYLAALGPVPYATMLLGDLGATTIRVDRPDRRGGVTGLRLEDDPRTRGHRGVGIDLRQSEGRELLDRLVADADVFLEGMRPGAAERLGIGPDVLLRRVPRLVYGRATGWGQQGPRAQRAGHDINYAGLSGGLYPVGPADRPPYPPLNMLADFGGGGTFLALGVLAALLQRVVTGSGQVVDAAMVDGVASLTTMIQGMRAAGLWSDRRGDNLLDGGAPFYRTYETADGGYMAVGALEPQFYRDFLDGVGLEVDDWPQHDRDRWPKLEAELERVFASRSRGAWQDVFDARDACVTPVLSIAEAAESPELRERDTFVTWSGVAQPAPAPRLSASRAVDLPRSGWCSHTDEVLGGLGLSSERIADLRGRRVIA